MRPVPALTPAPGLARRPPAWPPAEPGLTNFGLPARLAPSSAPPLGLPGPGPLFPSPVGHSNPIAEAQTRLCSQARLLSSPGRLRPCPSGLHQPGTWGSVSPVGPKPVSNRQTAAAQPNPPAPPPPPLRPGAGAPANSTITRLPSRVGSVCTDPPILWRKAGLFRRCHQREQARDWTGRTLGQYGEGILEDGRGEEPLTSEFPETGGGTLSTSVYIHQ